LTIMKASSFLLGALAGLGFGLLWSALRRRSSPSRRELVGLFDAVGDTKTVRLDSLSTALGHQVFVKLEFMNPSGTAKDRAARQILLDADHRVCEGGVIVEGTSGSTGIALTLLGAARGCRTVIFIPSDMAQEKVDLLRVLGSELRVVPPAPYANPNHYNSAAERFARADDSVFFANQFDNPSNWKAHFNTTGPELWEQMDHRIDVFVVGCGTGGMAAGVSTYLRDQNSPCAIILVDPPGSSLLSRVLYGTAYSKSEREGHRKRTQVDTVVEGMGLVGRVTANFAQAQFNGGVHCTDQECVDMARYILKHEGFFIGSSAAAHLVGVVRYARTLTTPNQRIATVLCDAGFRHLSKFWNSEFLASRGLLIRDFARSDLSFVE
jgi:cysteine synthase A